MVVESVLCMNPGDGETSYAKNSFLQKTVLSKARPFLEDTIKDMFSTALPTGFKTELGCSSEPNTLLFVSEIMDVIYELCQQLTCKLPEFQVFLNDLTGNDFTTVIKSLPFFYEKFGRGKGDLYGQHCFISAVPGSLYQRLFPSKSLQFFHSSYSLHWSKVPEGISNNKGNIYMAKASSPNVFKAYLEQFQKDFSLFLRLRSEEIIQGGRVVVTFIGRRIEDPRNKDCCLYLELLAKSLLDLAAKGLIVEADIDTFNLPCYNPYEGEVREIIEMKGSFDIDKLETFAINWDAHDDISDKNFVFDKDQCGRNVANIVRAVAEPMLVSHFGDEIMDELFKRYA
ncbi:PREDICTED: benzoate carboxyl methyltransferase-like [Populus euphratica]|uniref:Benzoate carboxyl methyltransferase-like n=1 Tax=Populus euphratica TaxID=75702 RepID=A0AAJ6XYV9_POPEU|nr:PREDICTED: benzoate carboxyl methyltransferase-like [Populus euphratica]